MYNKPNLISNNMKNILNNNLSIKKRIKKKKKIINNISQFDGNFFGVLIISVFIIGFYIRYTIINS